MHYNGFEYVFRGRRSQEVEFRERYLDPSGFPTYDIPCGKCELCRVSSRYSKALRIMLEADSWPQASYFITLTFDDAHLGSGDLFHPEWSQFVKNFRQEFCQAKYCDVSVPRHFKRFGKVRSKTFKEIKQVMCGEYGDTFGRKHFHGIIFNHSFSDVVATGTFSRKGNPIHTSASLQAIWKKGFVQVEEITFDLALYVGSYVTDLMDDVDVNVGHRKKQYGRFGKGIGESWIKKYWRDVLSVGSVKTFHGEFPIPRYFVNKIRELFPDEYLVWREANRLKMLKSRGENIEKGDGPLRRAQAEGRVFNHVRIKRSKDAGEFRSS